MKLENPCSTKTEKCLNCHNHFSEARPNIKEVIVSKHFEKDFPDYQNIVKDVLDCAHLNFIELHKFEEHINGNPIFRAKKEKVHFIYTIDKQKRLIFLRALKNFKEYKKFLENKKEITKMVNEATT